VISKSVRLLAGRGAGWKLGSDLLGRVLQYALLWAAARTLTQGDFGDFTFALSIGFMLAQVADFGLQLFVQRELARLVVTDGGTAQHFSDEQRAGRLVGGGLVIKGVLSVVAMALIIGFVLIEPVGNKGALVLVGLAMVLGTALDYLAYCFRAMGALRYEALGNLVARGLNLALGLALLIGGAGVWGLAVATNVAMLAAIAVSFRLLGRYVRLSWKPDWAFWRGSMGQPTAVGIGIVFSIISFRVDNLLIPPILGREALAVYNVAYKLFEPALIVPGVVLAATFPLLSQAAGALHMKPGALREMLGHTMLMLAGLGAAAVVGLGLLAVPLIWVLYGAQYAASANVLQVLALACLPMYLNYGLTHALIAADRPRLYAVFTLGAMFVNVAANLLFIPLLGVEGAAVATVATEVMLFALCAAAILTIVPALRGGSGQTELAASERKVEGLP
jgi:O-antigen/teichoic acid export membrane protein